MKRMDFNNYEVVRQELVSGIDDIFLTFNRGKMYINSYGLRQFPDEDYVYVMVDDDTKCMVLKPAKNKKRDNFKWSAGINKRKPRHVRCVPLFYLVYRMMQWDIEARYRITGELEDYGERKVLFFDLSNAICFQNGNQLKNIPSIADGQKMPDDWKSHFGMPVMDYKKRQDIKLFEDVAVFDVELDINKKYRNINNENRDVRDAYEENE